MRPDFTTTFPLRRGRVHEASGPAVISFSAMAALRTGPVIWIREAWLGDMVHPLGLATIMDPTRMFLARTANQTDSLCVAEEAMRDGALGFVVVEVTRPLNLREGRRLQLAAKAGGTTGLCLIPEGMGSNAAETRWHVRPVFDRARAHSTRMRWDLSKNKSGTIGSWDVLWSAQTRRVHVVSPSGIRQGATGARD